MEARYLIKEGIIIDGVEETRSLSRHETLKGANTMYDCMDIHGRGIREWKELSDTQDSNRVLRKDATPLPPEKPIKLRRMTKEEIKAATAEGMNAPCRSTKVYLEAHLEAHKYGASENGGYIKMKGTWKGIDLTQHELEWCVYVADED